MMSTSPISMLDNDALLMIFDSITRQTPNAESDTQKARPLTVIRAASQVCRGWRRLSLASPRIWGRVIDLGVTGNPGSRRIDWMDEVVKRAGSAPLWISGNVTEPPESSSLFNAQSYFICLLEEWERIERLSVVIFGEQIPEDIQTRFLSRAPILKLFDVKLPEVPKDLFLNTLQSDSSQSLFADHAPLLRVINVEEVAFKLNSPWLSYIREINHIPYRLTFKEIVLLLQRTPVLESVEINTTLRTWDGTLPIFPKPSLPNLSSIRLFTTLPVAARILDYISPAQLSTLHMIVHDASSVLNNRSILSSFKQNMPFYISSYFTSKPSPFFLLMVTNCELRFCDATRAPRRSSFEIWIRTSVSDQKDRDDVIACLLDAVTLSPTLSRNSSLFKPITELQLALIQVQPTLFQKVYSMFAVFQHVRVIQTTERSGQILWDISCLDKDGENQKPILFPELRILRLRSTSDDDGKTYTGLTSFLIQRKKIGFPVAKLDLTTPFTRSLYAKDFRALEEVDGLEVVWNKTRHDSGDDNEISSYICGSGDPEQLKGIF